MTRRRRKAAALREQLRDPATRATLDSIALPLPPDVARFLGRLTLLTGLPFNTIVADPRMLPPESIRFFDLDPNWTAAAIDGAMSVANVGEPHSETLALLAPRVKRQIAAEGAAVRTGFVLRSVVISDFPGLQIQAFADSDGQEPLPLLRLELLSPMVLIAIFEGEAALFTIKKPVHQLSFGVEDPTEEDGSYSVYLRGIGGGYDAGVSLPDNASWPNPVSVPMRPDPARQVLDIAALEQSLFDALSNAYAAGDSTLPSFQAGAFALQMVAAGERQPFKRGRS